MSADEQRHIARLEALLAQECLRAGFGAADIEPAEDGGLPLP
jgi:hypothetical protein